MPTTAHSQRSAHGALADHDTSSSREEPAARSGGDEFIARAGAMLQANRKVGEELAESAAHVDAALLRARQLSDGALRPLRARSIID